MSWCNFLHQVRYVREVLVKICEEHIGCCMIRHDHGVEVKGEEESTEGAKRPRIFNRDRHRFSCRPPLY